MQEKEDALREKTAAFTARDDSLRGKTDAQKRHDEVFDRVMDAEGEATELTSSLDESERKVQDLASQLENCNIANQTLRDELDESTRVNDLAQADLEAMDQEYAAQDMAHDSMLEHIGELETKVIDLQRQTEQRCFGYQRYFADMARVQGLQIEFWTVFMGAIESHPFQIPIRQLPDPYFWAVVEPWSDLNQQSGNNPAKSRAGLMDLLTQLYYHITNKDPEAEMWHLLRLISEECVKNDAPGLFVGVIPLIFEAAKKRYLEAQEAQGINLPNQVDPIKKSLIEQMFLIGLLQIGRFMQRRWPSVAPDRINKIQEYLENQDLWEPLCKHLLSDNVSHFTDEADRDTIWYKDLNVCLVGSEHFIFVIGTTTRTVRLVDKQQAKFAINTARLEAPEEHGNMDFPMSPANFMWWTKFASFQA
ncbi:hypothetical protein PFICI_09976 [Pestalotiopsis fici W106-1]|uniref:Uncharacterized protein n=1 Tax=Pestalotiopsis fici (strain W106-1 / CGMCC3.15140) TaxID=1229662 RepID=W3WVS1_PESFW|nr:uncharacterized protein PFICI_09976 [Pestalotiopsis fici W106-1]ETS77914.1 hypothetical protein PFICI_09976 [Pestalotiopsis fici W106-1]